MEKASVPKRAMVEVDHFDLPDEESDSHDVVEASTSSPSRRRRRLGRVSIASGLAGLLAVGGLFSWAWYSRTSGNEVASDQVATDAAVPEAAAEAVEQGFGNSGASSRSGIRGNLDSAVADENAKDHDSSLQSSRDSALENNANETAAERESMMEADLKLVAAQAEKIEAEKKAAEERLSAARESLRKAGVDTSEISAEDLAAASAGGGSMPLKENYSIGSRFGATGAWARYHTGQDFPAPDGTPIYAAASGIVLSPTAASWAGNNVVIMHMNGGMTLYAHQSQVVVKPGQAVRAGDLIGYVGQTGRSFGAHLHMEYYPAGTTPGDVYSATDPVEFLRSQGVTVQ
jgi:peptidase M23